MSDKISLNRYAERAFLALADHHAQIQTSFRDSWAVSPSQADLWLVLKDDAFVVDAVRPRSPASDAQIVNGDHVTHIGGVAMQDAVVSFWSDLGIIATDPERRCFAAQLLVSGRRDKTRNLRLQTSDGSKDVCLASSNDWEADRLPGDATVTSAHGDALTIKIQNALGDEATIAAFDAAMASATAKQLVILDLMNTPSGGNTLVARAIMGWFAKEPTFYQMHRYVAEERATEIVRQWVEQVLPRAGKFHEGPVSARVGRWTGSMGEGLAIGLQALGAKIEGHQMAGLRGAVHSFPLPILGSFLVSRLSDFIMLTAPSRGLCDNDLKISYRQGGQETHAAHVSFRLRVHCKDRPSPATD